MAKLLSAELFELTHPGTRFWRYLSLGRKTLELIRTKKPSIIFFQNPSLILSLLIALAKQCRITNAKIIGDYHNAGVNPSRGQLITKWVASKCDIVFVSNENLAAAIRKWGAHSVAIPDPIPEIVSAPKQAHRNPHEFVFLFVCSWAPDEPIKNVIDAASMASKNHSHFKIIITGRPKLEKYIQNSELPSNVILSGFLSEQDFDKTLHSADVVIDLTTREDCMVCGAYEAVAAERPAILSNNEPTRLYFSQGALFTNNSAEDIYQKMIESFNDISHMENEVKLLKAELSLKEKNVLLDIERQLASPDYSNA